MSERLTLETPADGRDVCPNCLHLLSEHDLELGCEHDWEHSGGVATREGCGCPLTLAHQHQPPGKWETPRRRREYVDPGFERHEPYCHLQHGLGGRCTCGR